MSNPSRSLLLFASCTLAVVLPACGAASLIPPSVIPTPTPTPQRTLVTQGSQSNIPPAATSGGAGFVVVVTLQGGGSGATLEGTVDWTFASNPVLIAWGRGDCRQNPNCEVISQNTGTGKPKTVSAVNQQAGSYSLIVVNAGTTNESISYQIFLIQ